MTVTVPVVGHGGVRGGGPGAAPDWAEELKATYLRGESSVFVLHGNVYDLILHAGEPMPLIEFLATVLLEKKDVIVHYNPATGVRFRKKQSKVDNLDELVSARDVDKALPGMERLLLAQDRVAVILDYAETIAPSGDTFHQTESDRRAMVTLHRWSLDQRFEKADNIIVLVTEVLSELSQKVVSNPRVSTLRIPLPGEKERTALIEWLEPEATPREVLRLAQLSAGLKSVQIRGILAPGEDGDEEHRYKLILRLLGSQQNAAERARKFAAMTPGKGDAELADLFGPHGRFPEEPPSEDGGRYDDVFHLLAKRKREILEKECFGLIEFVESDHDFSAVGGMDGVKQELTQIAKNILAGDRNRVPMGLLLTGPMGTGKTFVAEAFAKSSALTAIKMKNFRSKWVGSTEGNLEKILTVVKAIGDILVIIDEGDRAFGNTDGDGDGGTSSRVIARIKEFMSDTSNRGRVLFMLMTNRPDKLDIDIKRAGRLDRKIPFFYAQDAEEVEPVLRAQLGRHEVAHELEFPRDREVAERLVGYANADIEAVVLAANDTAHASGTKVTAETMRQAIADYMPSRDATMLEYMELLAVFESSSRKMLPKRYREMEITTLQERLRHLRAQIR